MRFRRANGEDSDPNIWPVVADVFIGFLVLILLTALVSYTDLTRKSAGRMNPPEAKEKFKERLKGVFAEAVSKGRLESTKTPKVHDESFAEIRLCFPASLLFNVCEIEPMAPAAEELERVKDILNDFDPEIERVQIIGHTDKDPPSRSPNSICYAKGIKTNWQLSALRAITITEHLAPDEGGLDPHKVWATALAAYHPANDDCGPANSVEEMKQRDRRIEVVIKFLEH